MHDILKKFLKKNTAESHGVKENDPNSRVQVASCAVLLEMANTDNELSEIERENIINLLKKDFHLSDEDAQELIEVTNKELKESIDLWHFTNLINVNYSTQEKIRVIETVWRVIYSDGKLNAHEDYLVHKLATLLKLTHKELIDAKLKVLYGK